MRWYEYKMEVDELKASEDLKARLLAMQNKAAEASAPSVPKVSPAPAKPAPKKAIRFPGRRVLEVAACAVLCGGILYGAARVGSLPSVALFSGGSGADTAAAYDAAPELATYSMADAGASTYRTESAANPSGSPLLTTGNLESGTARTADSAKIIYTADLSIETKDYDQSLQQLNETLDDADGYMESSSEYTDSTDNTRTLSLTLRVPEEAYSAFLGAAENVLGSVIRKSESADDVTTQYMDIEARLDSLTAQRSRLQELQSGADNLSDLLQIESSLSDVQYQIESYQSQLDWYAQQVDYCTVNITLDEVEILTTGTSFAARLADAAKNGWSNFTAGAQAVVVFLMGAWPAIVIGAACGVVFYQVRHPRKKRPNPKDAK